MLVLIGYYNCLINSPSNDLESRFFANELNEIDLSISRSNIAQNHNLPFKFLGLRIIELNSPLVFPSGEKMSIQMENNVIDLFDFLFVNFGIDF